MATLERFFGALEVIDIPEFLQVVELPDLRLHHVHDDIPKVDEYPLAGFLSLDANRAIVIVLAPLYERGCNGAYMASGTTVRNNHDIGYRGEMPDIQTGDGLGFEIVEYANDELDEYFPGSLLRVSSSRHSTPTR